MKQALTFILCLLLTSIQAQTKTISGNVSDISGPLPGVNVIVKGTKIGTQTDFDGNYSIIANKGDILEFSYVGFRTVTQKIGDDEEINITMEEDASVLDEVVVTAQGIRREKRSLGYAVSEVKGTEIKHEGDVARVLSGKASGVQITNSSGVAGANSKVVIRGYSSIQSNQQPLIIVDGVPYNSNQIENYNTTNENYKRIIENDFKAVLNNPLSTFSIDVDKAGYSNIRRLIEDNIAIPEDAVKIEEMINYFNYDYAQPTNKHPFAIHTEFGETPWNSNTKLVKIALKGKEIVDDKLPPSNITFLLDVSGSMQSSNKLPLLKQAFSLLVNKMRPQDKVAIVVYAGAAGVVLEPTSGDQKDKILNALNKLEAGGSTAGGAGIQLAYKIAKENFVEDGNNRVVLATDGDFNVGASSDADMTKLIEEQQASGIFLSVLGFGYGNYKDSKLEAIADNGNGNHAYIDSLKEARKVFGEEFAGTMYTIAKDVKIQVEFNPAKIKSYRLIGYENRLLENEDFKNDKKDAGELGSGHTVTALYEVFPVDTANNYKEEEIDLKYSNNVVSNDYNEELLTVKFRYKEPSENKSKLITHVQNIYETKVSEDFYFASSVALFSMYIRNSAYDNDASLDLVLELAEKGKGTDEKGLRKEFIKLVKKYQKEQDKKSIG
ncbi:MAG: YfbK domain-containing protein [bacterium]